MKTRARKRARTTPAPRARTTNSRQRQLLIDACISALHMYGPSGTTVEKVVAIAKMSPGIVRFYFDSKAAMLVASLKHLAAEFDERVVGPVSALKATPVAALELLVDLYLDPDIASARKVTVWYAYWGEASSRQEYYDICGQKDESFAQLVRDLVDRLIETGDARSGVRNLDPDGVALGLSGVFEILWQDIAYQTEDVIDRAGAKRRCHGFLRSVFPAQFSGESAPGAARLPNWTYRSDAAFSAEREALFRDAWSCVGHESLLPAAGDFAALETAAERVLLVRDATGELHAFRNACPISPHALVTLPAGKLTQLRCAVHGLRFGLDGAPSHGARPVGEGLTALTVTIVGGLILVRAVPPSLGDGASLVDVLSGLALTEMHLLTCSEAPVRADWKAVVEQWCEFAAATSDDAWTRRRYRSLQGGAATWEERLIAPNQWLQVRPDGITLREAVPLGAGRSLIRGIELSRCTIGRQARALAYLGSRTPPLNRRAGRAAMESLQSGRGRFAYDLARGAGSVAAAERFRRSLTERMPFLTASRAPADEA